MTFLIPVPGPARLARRHLLTSWLTPWLALLLFAALMLIIGWEKHFFRRAGLTPAKESA